MAITPEFLPLLRDPRRALPAFGHVGTQTSRQLQVQVSHKDMLLQITVDDGEVV